MKYSPTVTLALVLAAGLAGAAAAQTMTTPGAASTTPQTTAPNTQAGMNSGMNTGMNTGKTGMNYSQPRPGAAQPQASAGQTPSNYTGATSASSDAAAMPDTRAPGTTGRHTRRSAQRRSSASQASLENSSPDQVRTAQEQLQAAGLYNGPTDGMMDPDTRAAIARFQEQNGMQRTERLDQVTLNRLMSSRTAGSGSSEPAAPLTAPNGNQGANSAPIGAGGANAGKATSR